MSAPLVFDQAGVAAIGCNTYDHMVAYVVVIEASRAVVTGSEGMDTLPDPPAQTVIVSGPDAMVSFRVSVSLPRKRDPNSLY